MPRAFTTISSRMRKKSNQNKMSKLNRLSWSNHRKISSMKKFLSFSSSFSSFLIVEVLSRRINFCQTSFILFHENFFFKYANASILLAWRELTRWSFLKSFSFLFSRARVYSWHDLLHRSSSKVSMIRIVD